ncbi:MAG TPA: (Fe-S)-binding protein [Armatimonadota bacterium]|nr:(Fe-S)-binding protein [Armatimonadota bacterium]HPO73124.1 (Fe-S)-binding protein [Armatimonadota bacterium]
MSTHGSGQQLQGADSSASFRREGEQPLALTTPLSLDSCMRCGFCLAACPTYRHLGRETHSPRGRLALVKAATEGQLDPVAALRQPLDLCLGCRGCEPVCPAGVVYGHVLEEARAALAQRNRPSGLKRWGQRFLFEWLVPNTRLLRFLGGLLWFYEKLGVRWLARATGILKRLPMHLGEFEAALTDLAPPTERLPHGALYPAAGERRARVAFLTGCVAEALLHRTNRRTVQLLRACGFEVVIPKGQTCCGALHAHAGELEMARRLAKQNIAAFEASGAEFYVSNAGGCGAQLLEYPHLLRDDPQWAERAGRFAARVRDVAELIATQGALPALRRVNERVTYQDSCHLANVQKVKTEPRDLLRRVPGLELVEMTESDRCCGSAGSYSLLHFDVSMRILDEKMEQLRRTGATVVTTGNPGCLLQLRLGIHRAGLAGQVRAMHTVDLLAEACEKLPKL